jgi:hypothetical protein
MILSTKKQRPMENKVDEKEVFIDAVEVHDLVDCVEVLTLTEL